jgi:hypothetical protein
MSSYVLSSLEAAPWRALYKAALFEVDRTKLPARIAEAEKALISRGRELFNVKTGSIEEKEAVENTLFALRAFGTAWQTKSRSQCRHPEDSDLLHNSAR